MTHFLPEGITPGIAVLLVGVSFFASLITSAISLGGGILMMSVLALFFPPAILVPFHGAVQFGSNAGRAFVQRTHIQWPMVLWIALGCVLGSALGVQFAARLPQNIFQAVIGVSILVMIWLPRPKVASRGAFSSFVGGSLFAFVGMIVGVVGPLMLSFISSLTDRRQLVGTHAMLMTFLNGSKIIAFMAFGFVFTLYLPLILAMLVAGFVGTTLGARLLNKLPEETFRKVFKLIISVLALDLLRRALLG